MPINTALAVTPSKPRLFNGNRHRLKVGERQTRLLVRIRVRRNLSAPQSNSGSAARLILPPCVRSGGMSHFS
jgi:hypothetical protein